ncbi:MAG TPA: neutral zinc metallopeptidase [Polyangiaceae bacterium]|nr:neutral zinc metallopeptidase [Polyangiaceae bacterium]
MRIGGYRRSSNFEDRGRGSGGGGGIPIQGLFHLVRLLGLKGSLVVGAVLAGVYFLMPAELKQQLLGEGAVARSGQGGGSVCQSSPENGAACDFLRAVLASTEDVWTAQFQKGALPRYGREPGVYQHPTLAVFSNAVATGGCGNATSAVGPFYCPADNTLYIDPSFYEVMAKRMRAPGDFAQAYVIAHEVGHHIQNLIGSNTIEQPGESRNQSSVRLELQADCLAGVWGHTARTSLQITEEDLSEALTAAHAIGDDKLGASERDYTHGTSAQRKRWFRQGFDTGNPRQCDTFAVQKSEL